jgi:hypothetical protein
VSGISANSRRSLLTNALSVSRWALTETYSPSAIDTAPAAIPAAPAVATALVDVVAAATPTTSPAVDTIPSFAPNTPARSQFNFDDNELSCGSPRWKRPDRVPGPRSVMAANSVSSSPPRHHSAPRPPTSPSSSPEKQSG